MTVTSFFADTPLKDMDGGALALAIQEASPSEPVRRALAAASFLHRNQTRANRASLPRTAYFEHPGRNALRAIRWGVTDPDIIAAVILHDTAEDCADEIAGTFMNRPNADPERARRLALSWIIEGWGVETARLVAAVSNPLDPDGKLTKEQKRRLYADHVRTAIAGDAAVFIVKFADFVDNASGLHHNDTGANKGMVAHLAAKYLPVVDIFAAEFRSNPVIATLVSDAGMAEIGIKIDATRTRLLALAA
jgi:(p)ppGpp synthase/HD superfamily hydrolase